MGIYLPDPSPCESFVDPMGVHGKGHWQASPTSTYLFSSMISSQSPSSQLKYDSTCVFCEFHPQVPYPHTTILRDLLQCDSERRYEDYFQTIGILHDIHLRVLMGLGKDQRDAFLKESVPRKLTLLQYHVLTQMLDAWVEQQYKFAQTLIEIPRIAAGLEFFHSRPDTCPKLLAKRMRVSKDEYDILVFEIKWRLPWYLDICRPFEAQKPKQIEQLINVICEDYPLFKRYQDFWPILVIAKRILATPDAYRSSNVASNHGFDFAPPSPSASQSMSQYEEYTLPSVNVPQTTQTSSFIVFYVQQWQRHRHVCAQMMEYLVASGAQRVSPAAKALLSILHMEEELAPALWRLGVHFDEDFEMVKQMRSEGKKELVEGPTNGLRLKDFQKLVLHLIFKK